MKWEASSLSMQASFNHGGFYPQLLKEIPCDLFSQLQTIKNHLQPYTTRAYIVGGAVRDLVRHHIENKKIPIVDLDIEVYGIDPKDFEKIMDQLGAKGVGKSFFVYKYHERIDISLPRIESKVGHGHRGFRVELAKDEKEASRRRDFCMNALMLNVFDGKFLDFWGGVEDIKRRRIRIIDEEKFKEDSLRVLRGMQFSARLGYRIEKKSCEIMRSIALDDLSHERVFWEFEKMFQGAYPHFGLYYLTHLKIDRKIFNKDFSKLFFSSALELLKAKNGYEPHLKKFYFLYILANKAHLPYRFFLDRLHTPNEYYKIFRYQKALAHVRTDRYVAALALRFGLKDFLGNYVKDVKMRAKKWGFWESKLQAVSAKELMNEGFSGKALGEELRRRNLMFIRNHFKGRQ